MQPNTVKRKQNTNMKTENQIELTQTVAPRTAVALGRSVTMWVAVVAVIAGLSYVLTGPAIPPASAQPHAPAALVEFTPDGKLKQPVGYRKWVYLGTPVTPKDMNDGDDVDLRVPRRLYGPRELRSLREDGQAP